MQKEKLKWTKIWHSDSDYEIKYKNWRFTVYKQMYGVVGYRVKASNRRFEEDVWFNQNYLTSEMAKRAVRNFINNNLM